jgi:serine acetyltransferase
MTFFYNKVYYRTVRPLLHKVKRLRNFARDLVVCLWRGWDLRLITACDMRICKLPRTTHFGHPVGIVISSRVVIGEHCDIRQNVTIGERSERDVPVIGSHVLIGAGAIIVGKVSIGDHAKIGAGAVVLTDVPARTTYVLKIEPKYIENQGKC